VKAATGVDEVGRARRTGETHGLGRVAENLGDPLVAHSAVSDPIAALLRQPPRVRSVEHAEWPRDAHHVGAVDEELDLGHVCIVEVEELRAAGLAAHGA
jgi:hypothetical protein